jgi:AcrR family transcriptional regulator
VAARLDMVRTGRRDRDGSRRLLLDAARAEFAAKGLMGARVDEIARQAGLNKQLVYHYFGSKDDLYLTVLERVYAEIREQERGLWLGDLPPAPFPSTISRRTPSSSRCSTTRTAMAAGISRARGACTRCTRR